MMTKCAELMEKIEELHDQLDRKRDAFSEVDVYWQPDEDSWSVMQVLVHIAEFEPFFMNELKNVVQNPGVSWGRTMQHEGRLRAVEEGKHDRLDEVYDRIRQSKEYVTSVLKQLRDEDLQIESPHVNPKFGVKSMEWLVNHFIIEHLETHLKQLDRIVNQYEGRNK